MPYAKFLKGLELIPDIEFRRNYSQNLSNVLTMQAHFKLEKGFNVWDFVLPPWQKSDKPADRIDPEVLADIALGLKLRVLSQHEISRLTKQYGTDFFKRLSNG